MSESKKGKGGRPKGLSLTPTEQDVLKYIFDHRPGKQQAQADKMGITRPNLSKILNGGRGHKKTVEALRDTFRYEVAMNPDLLKLADDAADKRRRAQKEYEEKVSKMAELVRNAGGFSEHSAQRIARILVYNPNKLLSLIV